MPIPCICPLDDIQKNCKKNVSGLEGVVHVACLDDLLTSPVAAVNTYNVAALAMTPTKVFHTWAVDVKDTNFDDKPNEGGMREITYTAFIPRLESEKSYMLDNLGEENQICIVHDNNGKVRIIGDKTHGATVTFEEVVSPKNGYKLTIKCMQPHVAYFLTGAIPV